ncbi:unnamed protein product [Larinioides sclopetarius]|uniref:Uncharacterized protein n=1 Tax=Larinioides sclopetarius TaxID=280406 RepID=A0AAV1ZW43_9ARAC
MNIEKQSIFHWIEPILFIQMKKSSIKVIFSPKSDHKNEKTLKYMVINEL